MKIDTARNPEVRRNAQATTAAGNQVASFSAVLRTATTAASRPDAQASKPVDFTSMTRQQMQAWSNEQIRSGKMSLDDSTPFMAMSMHMPVRGDAGGRLQANDNGERLDFTQMVRAGIEGARLRNEEVTRSMLASALTTMQQYQSDTIGVDTHA